MHKSDTFLFKAKMKYILILFITASSVCNIKSFPCGFDNNIVKVCQCYESLINCANTRLSFIPKFSYLVASKAAYIDLRNNFISKPRILSKHIWKNLKVRPSKMCLTFVLNIWIYRYMDNYIHRYRYIYI